MSEASQFPETRAKAAEQLADRYMALWNEPDADRRRRMIAEFWTEDGSLVPPAAPGDARDHHDPWHRAGGQARGVGSRRARGADGRVQRNYTFVDGA